MSRRPAAVSFRKIVFWLHLACGVIAGLVIGIMAFTGVTLAFEKQIVAFAERDARLITPPAAENAPRVSLDDLVARARAQNAGARPTGITVSADPAEAVAIAFGRDATVYANPFTGEVRAPASTRARDFVRMMEAWHRWLALPDEHRALGRGITGACNAAFFVLAVTGLYLWWPRTWTRRTLRAIAVFDFKLSGKPRDWNWHNTAGSWCALILIVLTASGVVMSYRWANDLVYHLAGDPPPAANRPGRATSAPNRPSSTVGPRADLAALLANAQREFPDWQTISFRLAGPPRPTAETRSSAPITASVRTHATWPFFATTTLNFDSATGAVAKREPFSALGAGRRARTWLRFLHTGEAFGLAGQLVAGLASLGGCVLVYTGLALAWRRFFSRTP